LSYCRFLFSLSEFRYKC